MRRHGWTRFTSYALAASVLTCAAAWGQQVTVPARPSAVPPPNVAVPSAPSPAELMARNGGSLLRATMASRPDPGQAGLRDVSYFAVPEPEPRTIRKHDLITIVIREASESSSEANTELTKQASIDAHLEDFVKLNIRNFSLDGGAIGANAPGVKARGSTDFKGEGKTDRKDNFEARITAEVLDVKPNGTLVLQARKRIKTDEEEQLFILSGTCRGEDVGVDNTILSTQLYDLDLEKQSKGAVRSASGRGWIPKLLDLINPF